MEQSAALHWQAVVGCILLGIYGLLFLSDTWKSISCGEFRPLVNHCIALAAGLVLSLLICAVSKAGVVIVARVTYGIVILTMIVRSISVGSLRLGAFWTFWYISLLGLSILLPTFESEVLFFAASTIVIGESIGNLFYQIMLRKATHSALDDFFDHL